MRRALFDVLMKALFDHEFRHVAEPVRYQNYF